MNRTAANMHKLIERHHYATQEQVYEKIDAFLMAETITTDEYIELVSLIEQIYNPTPVVEETPVEETPTEEIPAEEPVTEPSADEPVSE